MLGIKSAKVQTAKKMLQIQRDVNIPFTLSWTRYQKELERDMYAGTAGQPGQFQDLP